MIDHELVRAWGWLFALAANGLLLWIGWTLRKKFVTQEDFSAHDHTLITPAANIQLATGQLAVPGIINWED